MPDARATKQALLVHQLGYTAARRRALLRLIGFNAADHAHAANLHRQVLVADVDRIVADFYECLSANAPVRRILGRGFALAHLRDTQRHYLLTLGIGFDSAAYFESRLRIGAVHARVAVPPSLYQAAYALLQRLILARVRVRLRASPRRREALTEFVVKIAALDMALAIETYHNARVGDLQSSLKSLRGRTAALNRRAATDVFTGVAHHARILAVLEQELALHHDRPLAIVILDVDRFKLVNDSCGHLAGDKVLQAIAARVRAIARRDDVVGRYRGGRVRGRAQEGVARDRASDRGAAAHRCQRRNRRRRRAQRARHDQRRGRRRRPGRRRRTPGGARRRRAVRGETRRARLRDRVGRAQARSRACRAGGSG